MLDQCYYQIEYQDYRTLCSYVLRPGTYSRIYIETRKSDQTQQAIDYILQNYPNATRIYSAQMEAEPERRRQEYKKRQATCTHENATITLYEKYSTCYVLKAGKAIDSDDEQYIAPDPLYEIDLECPDCDICLGYPDWREAPEPIRTYAHRCWHIDDEEED